MTDVLPPYIILPADEIEHRLASLVRKAGRLREAAGARAGHATLSREQLVALMTLVQAEAAYLVELQDLLVQGRRN